MNPIDIQMNDNHLIPGDDRPVDTSTGHILHYVEQATGMNIVNPRVSYSSQAAMATPNAQSHVHSQATNVSQADAFR
jgi:hypothetical protein